MELMDDQSEYVAARRVLLDALEALDGHRSSVVLVGAQAVYLRSGSGDLAVAPMTTDADLALHVDWIEDEPELYSAMLAAGFQPDAQPGTWRGRSGICVDLMVVPHQGGRSGKAARAASLPPHRKGVARIARGLEPALVDHDILPVGSLEADDERSYEIRIAGPSALLVAKIVKLYERFSDELAGNRSRVKAKDALDVYRLLREIEVSDFTAGFDLHAGRSTLPRCRRRLLPCCVTTAHSEEAGCRIWWRKRSVVTLSPRPALPHWPPISLRPFRSILSMTMDRSDWESSRAAFESICRLTNGWVGDRARPEGRAA